MVPLPAAKLYLYQVAVVCIISIGYSLLQYHYYNRCRSNLLKVLFYSNSDMCSMVHSVLTQVEQGCMCLLPCFLATAVRPFLSHAFGMVPAIGHGPN